MIPASMKIVPPIDNNSPMKAFLFATNVGLIISVDFVSISMQIIIALKVSDGSKIKLSTHVLRVLFFGAQRGIRTHEARRRGIYSPLYLTALPSTQYKHNNRKQGIRQVIT